MASRRELKKNIHCITFELISECLIYQHFHPDTPEEKINNIIEEVVQHRNDYLARVNNPDGKDNPELVKKHYRTIISDIRDKTIPLLDQLQDK
ncbi:MAG: hypothetical protein R6U58_09580 [Bacteroidales bacterium]